jgi:transposase InsO family protein
VAPSPRAHTNRLPKKLLDGYRSINAVAESFFGTLKAELTEHENYASRATAAASIADYIETFYNLQRRHSFLDYVSPIEFELKTRCTPLAA